MADPVKLADLIPADVRWFRPNRCTACLKQITLEEICVVCGRCDRDCECSTSRTYYGHSIILGRPTWA